MQDIVQNNINSLDQHLRQVGKLADIQGEDAHGKTPLMVAVENARFSMITKILEKIKALDTEWQGALRGQNRSEALSKIRGKYVTPELLSKVPQKNKKVRLPYSVDIKNGSDNELAIVSFSTSHAGIMQRQADYAAHKASILRYEQHDEKCKPEWNKITAIWDAMNSSEADRILWIDNDIVITNPSFKFRFHNSKELNTAQNTVKKEGIPFDDSIFRIKNSDWSRRYLMDVWISGYIFSGLDKGGLAKTMGWLYNHCKDSKNKEYKEKISIWPLENGSPGMFSLIWNVTDEKNPKDYDLDSQWHFEDFAARVDGSQDIIKDLVEYLDDKGISKGPWDTTHHSTYSNPSSPGWWRGWTPPSRPSK